MSCISTPVFSALLKDTIDSAEKLFAWLKENKGEDFELEEAFIVVEEYLRELRSFSGVPEKACRMEELCELVSNTMNTDV